MNERPTLLDTTPELSGVKNFLDILTDTSSHEGVLEATRQVRANYDSQFIEELRAFSELETPDAAAIEQLIEACAVVADYYRLSPEKMTVVIDEILEKVAGPER